MDEWTGGQIDRQTGTVAHLLKTRTVDPEKQPLLVNGPETTFVSRPQL